MITLLRNLYVKTEAIKGKKLVALLSIIFLFFTVLGLIIGYFINVNLNNSELVNQGIKVAIQEIKPLEYKGIVRYIDQKTYPNDNISYVLEDELGNEIILLTAKDAKLTVSENQNVEVLGKLSKTKDGSKNILVVEKVIIKNGTN